ncbi:nuclear transport factor 2 family protein [Mucilaginibacter koreensis]
MQSSYWPLIEKTYHGFNTRNIDLVFTAMAPDVHWPKAFEGGYVIGQDEVRKYWTRQWSEINPHVEPQSITERPDGRFEVAVHQLVKNLDGEVLFDGMVKHIYTFKEGLIAGMDVEAD